MTPELHDRLINRLMFLLPTSKGWRMAQLIVSMNLSVDGYIEAQEQDDGSWLRIDEAVHRAFNKLAASAEAFLYGRKVYEVMIPYSPAVDRVSALSMTSAWLVTPPTQPLLLATRHRPRAVPEQDLLRLCATASSGMR